MRPKDYDKQKRIKEAMVQLILRDGISGVSVSKIAHEAGVSPATIYVYYSSKDDMLSSVFQEYSHQSYHYLMRQVQPAMCGRDLIEAIIRGYYTYSIEHEEVFSFVEQCSRCPTLSQNVSEEDCCCEVFSLLHEYQRRGILKPYSDFALASVLFSPVRFLAMNRSNLEGSISDRLDELIRMMQDLLLLP